MEYCFLKGFLVVLLIQHCTSEDLSSIQSSMVVTLQEGQASPPEPELPPAEVVPVVAPPSLKEVQQAVQEASEQVEGRGAEEVLKELLERVVEAALGQVEGGGEAKAEDVAEQETVEEEGLERGETGREVEVDAEGEDVGGKGGDTGVEEEAEAVERETETVAGSVEETTVGVGAGGQVLEEVEVTDESRDAEVSQVVVEETVVTVEETGGDVAAEEAGVEDSPGQAELSDEKEAAAADTQEVEETPAVVEAAEGAEPEQEAVAGSDLSLGLADVEQIGDVWEKEKQEATQADEYEGKVIITPSDSDEMEITQAGEQEDEGNIVKDAEGLEVEDGHEVVVEGAFAEELETEDTDVGEAEEGGRQSVAKEESVALVNEGLGDEQAGEQEQIATETSPGSEKEDQEVLVISAPQPEDGADVSTQQSPENQARTTSPSLGWVEVEENTLGEKSNHGNEIITPTGDLLPHDTVGPQPTLDNFVTDVQAEPPQAIGEEPGEANELVEDAAGSTETNELGLEAWKIGAISAAVFLVLETVVIIIYILKCRNKNSVLALQRACEEGCVEPEAATGGDCSDDTLPEGNEDTQQLAALDLSDVASTLAQNKEQHEEENGIAMSDLPPSSKEESANTGPAPDSSQDLRTSTL